MSISNKSKERPLLLLNQQGSKSASDNNFITPGALTTLKFQFEFDLILNHQLMRVKSDLPPVRPLKKLYSVSNSPGKVGINL